MTWADHRIPVEQTRTTGTEEQDPTEAFVLHRMGHQTSCKTVEIASKVSEDLQFSRRMCRNCMILALQLQPAEVTSMTRFYAVEAFFLLAFWQQSSYK